jgi:hypothetical protein
MSNSYCLPGKAGGLPTGFREYLMQEFELEGVSFKIYDVSGTVLETSKSSETSVDSSSSPGVLDSRGYSPGQVSVSSSTTTTKEVWVETEGGKEYCVEFIDSPATFRAGHKVSLIILENIQSSEWIFVAAVNNTMGKYWLTDSLDLIQNKLSIKPNYKKFWIPFVVLLLTSCVFGGNRLTEKFVTSFAVMMIFVFSFLFYFMWKYNKASTILGAQIGGFANDCLKKDSD